jgi:hypothetical protein
VDELQIAKILEKLGLIVGDNSNIRYQVINITVPINSTAAQAVEQSATLDRNYNKIIGIGYAEISNADQDNNYNVGARSNRLTWIDDINIKMWQAESGVGPMFKFFKTNIVYGSGDTFFARVTPNGSPNAAFSGQMVLILQADLTEKPK